MVRNSVRVLTAVVAIVALLSAGVLVASAEENQNPFVVEIAIEGNVHVDESVIREAITSTVVGKRVAKEDVTADLQSIVDTGYFVDAGANFQHETDGIKVVFQVVEYPIVKDVVIKNKVLPVEELKTFMKTRAGQILNAKQLTEDVKVVSDKAFEEYGIAVRPADLAINDDGVVTLVLNETIIEDIKFEGNTKTKDYVISRELKIKPGDVLDINKVNESHRKLLVTGYFDEVTRNFTETENPDRVILTFNVTERKTGNFTGGVGYSSQDKFLAYAEIGEDNFLGRGERVSLRTEFAKGKTLYDIGFYEPWLDDSGTSLDLNLYRSTKTERDAANDFDYYDKRTGGNIALGRPIGDYTRASLRLKIENNEVTGVDADDVSDAEGTSSVRSLTLSTYTDTTNHAFYPTEGFRNRFSVEMAGRFLGGDTNFNRYNAEFSKYLKVGSNDQTVAFRVASGLITGDVPIQEQFRIGGAETVRGYLRGSEGFVGDKMLYANAEYRFKITDSVRGVLFTDAGRAWDTEEKMSLSELKIGYGVGVRLDTPIGIMRLDYGIGDQGGRASFSLGNVF